MNIDSRPGSTLRTKALAFATEIVQSSARDVVQVLFRRKWIILLVFVGVSFVATVYALTAPSVYESTAKLLIRIGRENMSVDPSVVAGPTMGVSQNRENELNSEITILTSRILAEKVVDSVGEKSLLDVPHELTTKEKVFQAIQKIKSFPLTFMSQLNPRVPLPPRDIAVNALLNSISVELEKKTNIISVAFDAKDPETARLSLEKLVEAYLERHIKVHQSQASPKFFEDQSAKFELELSNREKERDEFRVSHGISDVDIQKKGYLDQLSKMDGDRSAALAQAVAAEARVVSLEKTMQGRSPTLVTEETSGISSPARVKLKGNLHDMQLKETDMSARYPETYRPLMELREQIKQAEKMLAEEPESGTEKKTGLDRNYQDLKLKLDTERVSKDAYRAIETAIAAEIELVKKKLADLTAQEAQMTRLDRDVEVAAQEYRDYREGLQRARISAAMDMDKVSNVSVVQPATSIPVPVKPQKTRIVALGLFLGLFGGIFLAFTREYLDDTLHNKEDAEAKLGVPVLAVITNKEFKSSF